jgi:hypothetical protein
MRFYLEQFMEEILLYYALLLGIVVISFTYAFFATLPESHSDLVVNLQTQSFCFTLIEYAPKKNLLCQQKNWVVLQLTKMVLRTDFFIALSFLGQWIKSVVTKDLSVKATDKSVERTISGRL